MYDGSLDNNYAHEYMISHHFVYTESQLDDQIFNAETGSSGSNCSVGELLDMMVSESGGERGEGEGEGGGGGGGGIWRLERVMIKSLFLFLSSSLSLPPSLFLPLSLYLSFSFSLSFSLP